MIPATICRKASFVLSLLFLAATSFAGVPAPNISYVGAVSINPCQDPKILADWYAKLGVETKEIQGGYYCQIDTTSGPVFFGIHPKKANAPAKSSGSVSFVFRVENFEERLAAVKAKGLTPDSVEKDSQGQFAQFHDPDGNNVTLWGK